MTTFDANLAAMKDSILRSYSRRVAALLLPDETAERTIHEARALSRAPCGCRVCYWAKR